METNHVIDGIQQAPRASSDYQAPQTQLNERYRRPIRKMEQKPTAELTGMEEARAGAGSSRPFLTQVGHCMLMEAYRRIQLLPCVPRWVIWKPPPG